MKKLLITNDDGIEAEGLRQLAQALSKHYQVVVVAPDRQRSGVGLGLTLHRPIQIEKADWDGIEAWSLSGKPADCVKLGISVILKENPDMVIAGINSESNAGRNALYSGTVGGTIEAVLRGIPAIAFSAVSSESPDYKGMANYAPPLIDYFFDHPTPSGTLINVNFPNCPTDEILGVKYARQGIGYDMENPVQCKKTKGYFISKRRDEVDEHHESDNLYLEQGYISVSPLYVNDLTHHTHFKEMKERFESKLNTF